MSRIIHKSANLISNVGIAPFSGSPPRPSFLDKSIGRPTMPHGTISSSVDLGNNKIHTLFSLFLVQYSIQGKVFAGPFPPKDDLGKSQLSSLYFLFCNVSPNFYYNSVLVRRHASFIPFLSYPLLLVSTWPPSDLGLVKFESRLEVNIPGRNIMLNNLSPNKLEQQHCWVKILGKVL